MVSIEQFVAGLDGMAQSEFTLEGVAAYLAATRVDPDTLSAYLRYEPTHYTRNLVHKSERFELIAICWEVGQASRIHNHQGQNCWMSVPIGRLAVQNYEVVRIDPAARLCELREANRLEMDPDHPSHVEREMPIHSVLNLPEYGQRATSLHVYSYPYDRCLVYDLARKSYCEVPLFYDSEYGKPTPLTQP